LQNTPMRNIPFLRRRTLLRAGLLTLIAVGGVCKSQDTASPPSPKPAAEPKLILEVKRSLFNLLWGNGGGSWSDPWVVLRVFSDRSAEVRYDPPATAMKRTTLTPEQFEKVRSFFDHPDLLALKSPECGSAGADQITASKITLHHRESEQVIALYNFYPRSGYSPHWPERCPKIVVKLQCTVEVLLDELLHGQIGDWKKDCQDILAK
jgi:hypothetical protein